MNIRSIPKKHEDDANGRNPSKEIKEAASSSLTKKGKGIPITQWVRTVSGTQIK